MAFFRFLLRFTIIVLVIPAVALGYYQNPVQSQSGFTHSQKLQPDDTLAGKQLDGARIIRSSFVVHQSLETSTVIQVTVLRS